MTGPPNALLHYGLQANMLERVLLMSQTSYQKIYGKARNRSQSILTLPCLLTQNDSYLNHFAFQINSEGKRQIRTPATG